MYIINPCTNLRYIYIYTLHIQRVRVIKNVFVFFQHHLSVHFYDLACMCNKKINRFSGMWQIMFLPSFPGSHLLYIFSMLESCLHMAALLEQRQQFTIWHVLKIGSNRPCPWFLVVDRFFVSDQYYLAFRSQGIHTPWKSYMASENAPFTDDFDM